LCWVTDKSGDNEADRVNAKQLKERRFFMSLQSTELNICFYGAGSMAEAIVRGLIDQKITSPHRITMMNRSNAERLQTLSERYGVRTGNRPEDKEAFFREADIIVLAMKPKDALAALQAASPLIDQQLIVSVIAGLSISTMLKAIGKPVAISRTMPNTSSTIGLGATGISFSSGVSEAHKSSVLSIFRAIGIAYEVEEAQLDIVTGVSGSGPAYVYYFMEQMIAAGIQGGLTEETAKQLTVQTVLGAAQMISHTSEEPAELRRKVTSPNGTTQAALETLDRLQFPEAVRQAVLRAAERAGELGRAIDASLEGSEDKA
jgi:pyrroline-5-carboxylate reductase